MDNRHSLGLFTQSASSVLRTVSTVGASFSWHSFFLFLPTFFPCASVCFLDLNSTMYCSLEAQHNIIIHLANGNTSTTRNVTYVNTLLQCAQGSTRRHLRQLAQLRQCMQRLELHALLTACHIATRPNVKYEHENRTVQLTLLPQEWRKIGYMLSTSIICSTPTSLFSQSPRCYFPLLLIQIYQHDYKINSTSIQL